MIKKWARQKLSLSGIMQSFRILPIKDRRKFPIVILIQVFFGLLDLAGVALVGVLGALAVSGVEAKQPGTRVGQVLQLLHLENMNLQKQATILGLIAAALLITKTILSIYFVRKVLHFLSFRGAQLSTLLISKLFSQPLHVVQKRSSQESLYALTIGVNAISVGVLGATVNLIADITLLSIMTAGLFVVDPIMAISAILIFGAIAYLLYIFMQGRAKFLARAQTRLAILSNEKIMEILETYRESVVRNRRSYYARTVGAIRGEISSASAEMSFMPYVGKYVIEVAIVLGAIAVSALQFATQDARHAVATLSVFLAASTRIAPALLRLQQGTISIKSNLTQGAPTMEMIQELSHVSALPSPESHQSFVHNGFVPRIVVNKVTYSYPESKKLAVANVSLLIEPGEVVAFVGPSGAGKTTLIDIMLGVTPPDSGDVYISGFEPLVAISKWPGSIGYVPQDIVIANEDISGNVSLGFPKDDSHLEYIRSAIATAQLQDFVDSLPSKLHTQVGDKGTKLSGGQRQRLGIARALFTQPRLLVLDEATSSLDGDTEEKVSNAIQFLRGKVTVLLIAHRLSTVREADKVFYLEDGRLVAQGKFEDVRSEVPDFDRQARLMGL